MKDIANNASKMPWVIIVILVSATFSFSISFAQSWQTHSIHQGLAGKSVNDILVDQNGDIWVATNNGVSRFDGTWKNYRFNDGLAHNFVEAITQDDDGQIWFGTWGGISRINPSSDLNDSDNWQSYTVSNTDSGLSHNHIMSILVDREGKIWFGTSGGGISFVDPKPDMSDPSQDPLLNRKNWRTFTDEDGLGSNNIEDMELDANGNIWVATTAVLNIYQHQEGKWITFMLPPDANHQLQRIFKDRESDIWIATNGSGVFRVEPDDLSHYEQFTLTDGMAGNDVTAIAQDVEGAIWFGHVDSGVSMALPDSNLKDSDNWKKFAVKNGLASNQITAIAEDRENNMWFAHLEGFGVSQLDRTWLSFLTQRGSEANFVNGLFSDHQNSLWIATDDGLVKLNLDANLLLDKNLNDTLTVSNSGLSSKRVFVVFQDSQSYLWFGTNEGADRVPSNAIGDQSQWMPFNESNGLVSRSVQWIAVDRMGYLWFATGDFKGFNRVYNHIDSIKSVDRWITITEADGIISNQVFFILPDMHGNLWFATDKGVSLFDPALDPKDSTNWTNYDTSDGLINNRVRSIYEDLNGNIWFATNGGVSKIAPIKNLRDPANWTSYTTENTQNGLASNFVTSINQFQEDEIWFGTAIGASKFRMSDNISPWTTFTTSYGLKSNFIKALFIDKDRKDVWFGTSGGGVTRYRPKPRPPKTFLSTRYDAVTHSSIIFKFFGADVISPDHQLRYQHRLDDLDWKTTFDKSATVFVEDSNQPRRHIFQVRAIDGDGNIDPEPATDVFYKINPRFGGSIEFVDSTGSSNRARMQIPPRVLNGDTSITITPVKRSELSDSLVIVAYKISFSPESYAEFKKPAALTILFLNTMAYRRDELSIFRQRSDSDWEPLGGTVEIKADTVTITTVIKKLGTYAVRNIRARQADPASDKINVQPRIFSPAGGGQGYGDRASISFVLTNDATTTIKIYDLAGRLKRIITENTFFSTGTNVVDWDGRDDEGRVCVSGLYIVTIEAEGRAQTKTVMVANQYD